MGYSLRALMWFDHLVARDFCSRLLSLGNRFRRFSTVLPLQQLFNCGCYLYCLRLAKLFCYCLPFRVALRKAMILFGSITYRMFSIFVLPFPFEFCCY
jgi:hypothetical protein